MFHTTDPARHDAVSFVRQSWPAEPRQLAPIRAEVRRWLASLGVGEEAETDMVLAVNEAVTNAVVHASNSASDTVELAFWTKMTAPCASKSWIMGRGGLRRRGSPVAGTASRLCTALSGR